MKILGPFAFVILSLFGPVSAIAQPPMNILHEFPSTGAAHPAAELLQAADGTLYGTTQGGGASNRGTIFRMTPDGKLTVLHSFRGNVGGDPTDGAHPFAALIQASDSNFYVTTPDGGRLACGTIKRMTPDGVVTTVHEFAGIDFADGCSPSGGLVQASDGHLYGTTHKGGRFQGGTVFRMTLGGAVTVLHSFFRDNDGETPFGTLIQATDGHLYGTTMAGGTGSRGTVFRITVGGALTIVHAFDGTGGTQPTQGVVQGTDGNLYGTTSTGAAAIFRVTLEGAVTWLHTFPGGDGTGPSKLVQAAGGNFYGATVRRGREDRGTLFRISPEGAFTTLHSFTGIIDGAHPRALIVAADGMLYGVTSAGGSVSQAGTVFRFSGSGPVATVHVFDSGGPDGRIPAGALIEGPDGNVYGITSGGGTLGHGMVFTCDADGVTTVLHEFAGGAGGATPAAGLFRAPDGTLYGTTLLGGASDRGIVYRLAPDGAFTVLHAFTGGPDGGLPSSALIQATDGRLYGTTLSGGTGGYGTIFRLTTSGGLVTLHSFSGLDGATPVGGVIQASDGGLYGTTLAGGVFRLGTIFKVTLNGVASVRHVFSGLDGALPLAGLHQAADGQFYGTTTAGGAWNRGVVFRMAGTGAASVLHAFAGADGAIPSAPVIHARDGYLYGTTLAGGPSDQGTIFKLSMTGVLFTIHAFTGTDGSRPFSALVESARANQFLGTTLGGGLAPERGGVVYLQFVVPCEDTLALRYSAGTLFLDFTIESPSAFALWDVWIVSATGVTPLWSVSIPYVSPAVSFTVPIAGTSNVGTVGVFTRLSPGLVGPTCGDWRTINTGSPIGVR